MDVAIAGDRAYVTDILTLQVIGVSDPANPEPLGALWTLGDPLAVAVQGTYAYVAADAFGLQVVDVSNPAMLEIVGSVDTPGRA